MKTISIEKFKKLPLTFIAETSAIRLVKRNDEKNDNHILMEIYDEDDGMLYHVKTLSTSWIKDTKKLLNKVESYLKTQTPSMGTEEWNKNIQYGYEFNKEM